MKPKRYGRRLMSKIARRTPKWIKKRIPESLKRRLRRRLGRTAQATAKTASTAPVVDALGIADGRLTIEADSVGRARALGAAADLTVPLTAVQLIVRRWRRPMPGWSGSLGRLPDVVSYSVRLPKGRSGRATVGVELATPISGYDLLDAALRALDAVNPLPVTLTPELLVADGRRPPWLRTSVQVPSEEGSDVVADAPGATSTPATSDLCLTTDPSREAGPMAVYSRYGITSDGAGPRVLVDTAYANPIGRTTGAHALPSAILGWSVSRGSDVMWQVLPEWDSSEPIVTGRPGDPLDDQQRSALAGLRSLTHIPPNAPLDAEAHAATLAQVAATGVVLEVPSLRPDVRALLGKELAAILTSRTLDPECDPLEWDLRSVAQRRAAMRQHDAYLAPLSGLRVGELPTVTALVVSRRPQYIPRIVADMVAQTYPRLEVVVAMHGQDLDAQTRQSLAEQPIPIEVLVLPSNLVLGELLASATQRARGTLVTKVDDDDFYGPEHIWDLVLARRYSGATVVGKGAEFVYLTAEDSTIRRAWASETYSSVVAGGTMLMVRGDIEAVGGWRPVPRSVDRALLDRVLKAGGLVYRTHPFGFLYTRHDEGHTWDPGADWFLKSATHLWRGLPAPLRSSLKSADRLAR